MLQLTSRRILVKGAKETQYSIERCLPNPFQLSSEQLGLKFRADIEQEDSSDCPHGLTESEEFAYQFLKRQKKLRNKAKADINALESIDSTPFINDMKRLREEQRVFSHKKGKYMELILPDDPEQRLFSKLVNRQHKEAFKTETKWGDEVKNSVMSDSVSKINHRLAMLMSQSRQSNRSFCRKIRQHRSKESEF